MGGAWGCIAGAFLMVPGSGDGQQQQVVEREA